MEQKFYICAHCGNIIAKVKDAGVPVMCCGQKMDELVPGTVDASVEKHVPAFTVEGNIVKVKVGSVEHPMAEEHYIEWVSLQTKQGNQRSGHAKNRRTDRDVPSDRRSLFSFLSLRHKLPPFSPLFENFTVISFIISYSSIPVEKNQFPACVKRRYGVK